MIVIEQVAFFLVDLFHGLQPADGFLQPFHHQVDGVDGKAGRRVVHGIVFDEGGVLQHGRQVVRDPVEHVLADDDQADAGRPDIFLGAGIDQPEGAASKGRHMMSEDMSATRGTLPAFGKFGPLGAFDGVVGGEMDVGRIRVNGIFLGI